MHPNLLISGLEIIAPSFRTFVTLSRLFAEWVHSALAMLRKNSSEYVCVQAALANLATQAVTHSSSCSCLVASKSCSFSVFSLACSCCTYVAIDVYIKWDEIKTVQLLNCAVSWTSSVFSYTWQWLSCWVVSMVAWGSVEHLVSLSMKCSDISVDEGWQSDGWLGGRTGVPGNACSAFPCPFPLEVKTFFF